MLRKEQALYSRLPPQGAEAGSPRSSLSPGELKNRGRLGDETICAGLPLGLKTAMIKRPSFLFSYAIGWLGCPEQYTFLFLPHPTLWYRPQHFYSGLGLCFCLSEASPRFRLFSGPDKLTPAQVTNVAFVTTVAATKYQTEHRSLITSSWWGRPGARSWRQLATLYPQSGHTELGCSCSAPF